MSYDVFTKDGEAAGKLTVTRVGPRTVFEYQSDFDPGVSRLALICGSAVRSLGIPSQRAGGLYLKKTLTRLEMEGWETEEGLTALLVPAEVDISSLAPSIGPEKPPAPENDPTEASAPETEEGAALPVMEIAPPKPEERPKPMPEPPETPKPQPEEKPNPQPALEEKPRPEPEPEKTPQPAPGPEETPEGLSEDAPHEDKKPLSCPAPGQAQWREEPDPAKYFSDPALKTSAARCSGALVRDEEEGVCLAFPWTSSAPFPMLEIFRLCSTASIGGTEYITYRVRNGEPI